MGGGRAEIAAERRNGNDHKGQERAVRTQQMAEVDEKTIENGR